MHERGCRRLLLIAREPLRSVWCAMFPPNWEIAVTDSVEHARLVQHVGACDVVMYSSDRLTPVDPKIWVRLFVKDGSAVVIVADRPDEKVLDAIRAGAAWLPATMAREQPALLLTVLVQAMTRTRHNNPVSKGCRCQSRVDRLLDLLWQATPGTVPGPWFSQRHMFERLDEEVARTQRDGSPLSVILGEVRAENPEPMVAAQLTELHEWAALQIGKGKRRCDVAGQYGLDGFMLVLPRATPEQAKGACRRLRNVLSHPPQGMPKIHVRFGHAGIPGDRPNISALLSRAEQRLEDSRLVAMS